MTQSIEAQVQPARRGDRFPVFTAAVAVGLILLPGLVKLFCYADYPGPDDAFIHIAVAEHVLHGEGWGIISNDRMNLSSSPVFTLLLLPVLTIGSIGLAQILSLAFASTALLITFFVTRSYTSSNMCGIAALAVAAANIHLWRWSGTVMETSLAYLLVTVIAAFTLRLLAQPRGSRWDLALLGVLIGVGTLVRFEIGLFLPLSIAALAISRRAEWRQIAGVFGGFVATMLPWVVFASSYFGAVLPTTFYAKTGGLHFVNPFVVQSLGTVVVSGFGLSLVLGVVALILAARSSEGRAGLRGYTMALLFLIMWPVALFAFYYLKTNGVQSPGRYFLPGMATWPIALGIVLSAVPRMRQFRQWLAAALVGSVAAALAINATMVAPVLSVFNGEYRTAMARGAEYLREHCKPGDVALVEIDIGIMADDGIGDCTLMDGGALASPSLRGMDLTEKLAHVRPTYFVRCTGLSADELAGEHPQLELLMSEAYTDHGLTTAGQKDYMSIFAVSN
jgi:hypothetical protein